MIFNPYVLLGLIMAFLLTFGSGYYLGSKHERNEQAAEQLEILSESIDNAGKQAEADNRISEDYETARETVRTVYVKIKEETNANIEKNPDYADCSLDDDGLHLYNANPNHSETTATGTDG